MKYILVSYLIGITIFSGYVNLIIYNINMDMYPCLLVSSIFYLALWGINTIIFRYYSELSKGLPVRIIEIKKESTNESSLLIIYLGIGIIINAIYLLHNISITISLFLFLLLLIKKTDGYFKYNLFLYLFGYSIYNIAYLENKKVNVTYVISKNNLKKGDMIKKIVIIPDKLSLGYLCK